MPKDFLKPLKNNDFYHGFENLKKHSFSIWKNYQVVNQNSSKRALPV